MKIHLKGVRTSTSANVHSSHHIPSPALLLNASAMAFHFRAVFATQKRVADPFSLHHPLVSGRMDWRGICGRATDLRSLTLISTDDTMSFQSFTVPADRMVLAVHSSVLGLGRKVVTLWSPIETRRLHPDCVAAINSNHTLAPQSGNLIAVRFGEKVMASC